MAFATPVTQPITQLGKDPLPRLPNRQTKLWRAIVIFGGTSGVGLETVSYLKSKKVHVTAISRRTGHDLTDPVVVKNALDLSSDGLAITVGAGRHKGSQQNELALYRNILSVLEHVQSPAPALVVTVVRTIVFPDVRDMLLKISSPWVLLRPGPLDDRNLRGLHKGPNTELLIVTTDMRCNGIVSRHGVAKVIGDLLMHKVPISEVSNKILGIYDRNRMISIPKGIQIIGGDVWGSTST